MQAVRLVGVGQPAQIAEVAKPSPGPGQVLIKIGGAGVCHSGSRVELTEVIAIARDGRIDAETTEFRLIEAVEVYARLKAGRITGRAVLIPA